MATRPGATGQAGSKNAEQETFSVSRLFAAIYPEAISIAVLIGSPTWRRLAGGDDEQLSRFTTAIGWRLGEPLEALWGGAPARVLGEFVAVGEWSAGQAGQAGRVAAMAGAGKARRVYDLTAPRP